MGGEHEGPEAITLTALATEMGLITPTEARLPCSSCGWEVQPTTERAVTVDRRAMALPPGLFGSGLHFRRTLPQNFSGLIGKQYSIVAPAQFEACEVRK